MAGSDFTSLGNSYHLVRLDDAAYSYLQQLERSFPEEFPRALRNVAYTLRGKVKSAIYRGGVPGMPKWPEITRMRQYRRMEMLAHAGSGLFPSVTKLLKPKRTSKRRKKLIEQGVLAETPLMDRWKKNFRGAGKVRAFGSLGGVVRYKLDKGNMRVMIGFMTPSTASFAEAVMGARKGAVGTFSHTGRQFITQKMRKAFFAAGVPLSKDKHYLEQAERPLVAPVWRSMEPDLEKMIAERIVKILDKAAAKSMSGQISNLLGR